MSERRARGVDRRRLDRAAIYTLLPKDNQGGGRTVPQILEALELAAAYGPAVNSALQFWARHGLAARQPLVGTRQVLWCRTASVAQMQSAVVRRSRRHRTGRGSRTSPAAYGPVGPGGPEAIASLAGMCAELQRNPLRMRRWG